MFQGEGLRSEREKLIIEWSEFKIFLGELMAMFLVR
jgi:hypothetical protein